MTIFGSIEKNMPTNKYDIIIIGGGSAGLGAIGMAQKLGWKPLLIDKEEAHIGGDCLNFGCVPSKAIIHVAKQFYGAKKATAYGTVKEGKADMEKVLAYIHSKQAVIRAHENAAYFRKQGVAIEIGTASFVNGNTIAVGDKQFTAPRILLATGSKPRMIPFKGLEQVEHYTNETLFYKMKKLPDRLLVIGGGAIGCEMGQTFQRLGSQVTIVNRGERILKAEREDSSKILAQQFEAEGIQIIKNSSLKEFTDAHTAIIENKAKEQSTLKFDAVLFAIGRVLNYDDLNLAAGGVKTNERGRLIINDYLQTTNKNVYVAGDAAGMYKFSHGAEKHIKLLTHNFTHLFKKKHAINNLSWVTFTDPEVATFGLTEKQLKEQGKNYWRQDQSFHKDDRAIVGEFDYGKVTLFLSPKRPWSKRKILGGSIIAPNAGELIQELLLAANEKVPAKAIYEKLYAYPVASRINQQTIMGVMRNDEK